MTLLPRRDILKLAVAGLAGGLASGCRNDHVSPVVSPVVKLNIDPIGEGFRTSQELARRYEARFGVQVAISAAHANSTFRQAQLMQFLSSRQSDIDVYMIDVIWPPLLAQDLADVGSVLTPQANQFFPALVENNRVRGTLVAVPWYLDSGLLYYRSDLLEKYGYSAPPATWPELEEMAARIQAGERQAGKAEFWGYLFDGHANESLTCNGLEWQASEGGGRIIEEDGTISIANEKAAAAFDRARRWIGTISPDKSPALDIEMIRSKFQHGEAAFMRSWSYAWVVMETSGAPAAGKIGVAPMPAGATGRVSALGGWHLAIGANSSRQNEALRLVEFLTSPESMLYRALEGGFPPTRPELYHNEGLFTRHPHMKALGEAGQTVLARPSRVAGRAYNEVSAAYYDGLHSVLRGEAVGAQAVEKMEVQMRQIMKK